jgi:2-polyprenyl-6-methoxyphenol hydroxylase-like FAD-dependent oxidoreductase
MLLRNKQVAIIGGGPGGLILARLLQQQGIAVKVYERDATPDIRPQGSALDLHYDTGLKALEAAGLLEEFKQVYRPGADKMRVLNGQLDILLDEHAAEVELRKEDFGDASFRPEIDRGPLRDLLVASLQPGTVVWNARFTQLQPAGSGWDIEFENGARVYADVVVACDGANSRLRHYLTATRPVYAGVTLVEGTIVDAPQQAPALWQLVHGGSLMALEAGHSVSMIAKADGTLIYWLGVKAPADWLTTSAIDFTSKEAVAAWFAQEFSTWSPQWSQLFTPESLMLVPRPMYYYPANQHWPTLSNLTMIGDAAHRLPPYAGEGANQALADALELSEALGDEQFTTTEQAIASFEQKMISRLAIITAETLRNTAQLHADNNQQFLLSLFNGAE